MALGLLTALPLTFYATSAHHSDHAVVTGGIAMAFSIAGASIFAALTARPVDQPSRETLGVVEQNLEQMFGSELLVAFAQRQRLRRVADLVAKIV